jgi:hypothetical protein
MDAHRSPAEKEPLEAHDVFCLLIEEDECHPIGYVKIDNAGDVLAPGKIVRPTNGITAPAPSPHAKLRHYRDEPVSLFRGGDVMVRATDTVAEQPDELLVRHRIDVRESGKRCGFVGHP